MLRDLPNQPYALQLIGKEPTMTSVYPATMTIGEFRDWSRLGRTKTYELIKAGEIAAIKVGRRTLILTGSARLWLNSQPAFGATMTKGA